MKSLLCALALCTMFAPARAQDAATAPASTETTTQSVAPEPVELDNGLIVTPVILPYDELGEMLGAKLWRFRIEKPPAPVASFGTRLVLRTPGEGDKFVGTGASGAVSHEIELTLGLLPSNELSLDSADKWRVRMHRRDISEGRTVDNGTSTSDGENPIKNWEDIRQSTLGGFDERYGRVQTNGESTLITFEHGPQDKRIRSQLILIFLVGDKLLIL